jgi:hypothetical protein
LKSTVSTALQPQVFTIEASAELTIFNLCVLSYFKHSDNICVKGHVKMFSLRLLSSCLRPQEQGLLEIWNLACQPECLKLLLKINGPQSSFGTNFEAIQ